MLGLVGGVILEFQVQQKYLPDVDSLSDPVGGVLRVFFHCCRVTWYGIAKSFPLSSQRQGKHANAATR